METFTKLAFVLIISSLFSCASDTNQKSLKSKGYDIIVIGGGASGVAAGLQSARQGANTLIIEETEWLGGMLTSAGVSAIDGNHNLPSGIWGEFRDSLVGRYGSLSSLATGWVSNTLFAPEIGEEIFTNMTSIQANLSVRRGSRVTGVVKENGTWSVTTEDGVMLTSTILIDATELGDIAAMLNVTSEIGMRDGSSEPVNANSNNDIIQDLTFVAILDRFQGDAHLLEMPNDYDPEEFLCACKHKGRNPDAVDCQTMLDYGKLPDGKYMINWPNCGNDIYLNIIELSHNERQAELEKAKQMTFRFVYFIQNELGFKDLGLSRSTFPTEDNMPLIPYHRESRRIKGKARLLTKHLENPYNHDLYRTGIAVGDYPIDHHHDKNKEAPEIDFIGIKVPSYSVPLGSLIPLNVDNFIVAEKSISVSNIVNGATRLQPVVLGIGQAAGAIAGTAMQEGLKTAEVPIRRVQKNLLRSKAYIQPFMDVKPDDPDFEAIQQAGVIGILKGTGIPFKWANQTFIYPDSTMLYSELKEASEELGRTLADSDHKYVGPFELLTFLSAHKIGQDISMPLLAELDKGVNSKGFLTRRFIARIIEKHTDLFSRPINFNGNFITE